MADIREAILARLLVVAGAVVGVDDVVRNKLLGDDSEPRRLSLLEGDEEPAEVDPNSRRGINVMRMTPQLIISAAAKASEVGSDLNALRARLIQAIETDADLRALTLNNNARRSGIKYLGLESDLAFGRTMFGQMALKFQFTYLLNPSEL